MLKHQMINCLFHFQAQIKVSFQNGSGTYQGGQNILTISPIANQHGISTLTVTVTDAAGESDSTIFELTVNPVQDSPVAQNDADIILENSSSRFSVLDNDYDVDGDEFSITNVTSPQHGTTNLEFNDETNC